VNVSSEWKSPRKTEEEESGKWQRGRGGAEKGAETETEGSMRAERG
jgi:hypothetical protein